MTDDPYANRRRLTFEQAEGAEPLPVQLQLKELSQELRALLWFEVSNSLRFDGLTIQSPEWQRILLAKHVHKDHRMVDEMPQDRQLYQQLKSIISRGSYIDVFGFLQFVLRNEYLPYQFAEQVDSVLWRASAAYRVLDNRTIIPITSEAERLNLERAFLDIAATEFRGARKHLHSAGSFLTAGDYASSVRESVHSVESVARTLAPSGQLSEALAKLEKSSGIHGGLKRGFTAIYGYTSDEKGIRHPLLDDPQANVDEADALFMIGACAAFLSYMIHKARLAGLLTN